MKDFTTWDLRRVIGQNMCLRYLMPLALRELHERPHADGGLYEGALLNSVLSVEAAFWETRPHLAAELLDLINGLTDKLSHMASFERDGVLEALDERGKVFLARCGIAGASLADHGRPVKDEDLTDDDFAALAAKFFLQLDHEEK